MSLPQSEAVLTTMQMQGIKGNDVILDGGNEEMSHTESQYRTVFLFRGSTNHLQRKSRKVSVLVYRWVYFQKPKWEQCSGNVPQTEAELRGYIKGQYKINKGFSNCKSYKDIPVEPQNINIDLEMYMIYPLRMYMTIC